MTDISDWTRFRTLLAVLRTGSQSAAARDLGLAQPSVKRHLDALERDLGRPLFVRSRTGLSPLPAAEALRAPAEAMEAAAALAARRLDASAAAGTVRLGASPTVAATLLPPILADLRRARPGLRIEVEAAVAETDLLAHGADLALRLTAPRQLDLLRRRVGTLEIGLHAHPGWVARHGAPATMRDLHGHLLGPDRDTTLRRLWAGAQVPDEAWALRCDDDAVLRAAIHAGVGVGALPVAAADGLTRVLPEAGMALPLWLTAHADARADPHVAAVWDALAAGVGA
ncbi:LysR family transcriptional regulator [Jannaschia sp. Os4]|uniref:LysR family transcriptional regulator n=1 Tax=Jannaschia sp. Os4 TaxID=2807617 RepID=UPI00193AC4BC|nr:LysR family transcriptional regulator [Jannaschia sp. Os4]MBM2575868.1 LysR family transcriptional regulator [Jannaschia sp. Os4]